MQRNGLRKSPSSEKSGLLQNEAASAAGGDEDQKKAKNRQSRKQLFETEDPPEVDAAISPAPLVGCDLSTPIETYGSVSNDTNRSKTNVPVESASVKSKWHDIKVSIGVHTPETAANQVEHEETLRHYKEQHSHHDLKDHASDLLHELQADKKELIQFGSVLTSYAGPIIIAFLCLNATAFWGLELESKVEISWQDSLYWTVEELLLQILHTVIRTLLLGCNHDDVWVWGGSYSHTKKSYFDKCS